MKIRLILPSDLEQIRNFHNLDFPLPDFEKSVVSAVVEDEGRIVAAGAVEALAEANFVSDLSTTVKTRLLSMDRLMSFAVHGSRQVGYTQLHVFTNEDMARILMKHFGFEPCRGIALVRNL